jgi:TRAP-type C4-dicarboxylate transport system substrate-binding protein
MKRFHLWQKVFSVSVILLATMLILKGSATAEPTTIRFGNWVPMHHLMVQGIFIPWTQAIEKDSGGTLKFEIMKSALGRPNTYFDLVHDGTLDAGWGVSGHNPGRFTMTQVMDLPFMSPDPWAGSAAAWLTYEKFGQSYGEHKGVKIVGLYTHTVPYFNMRDNPILKVSDLSAKKIRVGGNFTGQIVSALGSTPVQLPPTETQQAMARGVADGITFPLESVEFFKITPVIKSSTLVPGGLYTDTFWVGFNEAKWKSLTDQQRAAILKHSGLGLSMLAAWAWTNGDNWGRAAMLNSGVKFNELPEEEATKMKQLLKPMEDEWLAEAKKRGFDGNAILDYAKFMTQQYRSVKRVNIP